MGVDVVRPVLGIVFQDEERGVIPVRAVGDGLDRSSHRQVVIRDRSLGRRHPWSGSRGVVVGKAKLHQLRHRIVTLSGDPATHCRKWVRNSSTRS